MRPELSELAVAGRGPFVAFFLVRSFLVLFGLWFQSET